MTSNVIQMDPWQNATLDTYRRPSPTAIASTILRQVNTGCSPMLMSTQVPGELYWVKPQHNEHGQNSLLAEQVVAAVGRYLGAPIPHTTLIEIPDAFSSYRLPNGSLLVPGTAHASRHVESECVEDTELLYVPKDGNRYRAPKFIALWEWCFGEDPQWLYAQADDYQLWTFDHGLWLGGGGEWEVADLRKTATKVFGWSGPVKGMDSATFAGLADAIESCTVSDLLSMVSAVPVDWGFTDFELIEVARWLDERRESVVTSLRQHARNTTS